MTRHAPWTHVAAAILTAILAGCQPQMPFYLKKTDGDLDHYIAKSTDIEAADVSVDRLADVSDALAPLSLRNRKNQEIWDLTLEEAVQNALKNNKVMRNIGGQVQGPPEYILRNPESIPTIYDPALAETNPRTSAEAALASFDAQLSTTLSWEKRDRPQNINESSASYYPVVDIEDLGQFQTKLQKTAATGGTFSFAHNVEYAETNSPTRAYTADWNVALVAEMRQPLLQGAGVQFNRIAGPGAVVGQYNGVVLARINTDVALTNFEMAVRNLVSDVEIAYWELYFEYRSLDAVIAGRDSALTTWRRIYTLYRVGAKGGEAEKEAQAREQYFLFRSTAEQSLNALYVAEAKLRYLLGLAATDGRLIRPKDEPTTAKVAFDWHDVLAEGLARSAELRQQKWIIKRRELELIASKNFLLPRLDLVAQYRWLGLGNRLDGANALDTDDFLSGDYQDSNAYRTLTSGNFQEWQVGVQGQMNLGFRRELAGVRNAELQLAREQTVLQEGELELSHQLAYAVRDLETNYVLSQTAFNRRIAAQRQVEAVAQAYETDTITLDVLLQAQQTLAQAESDYYRRLVDYNRSIAQVHYRKGSLLEYNGVYLAEGPWPGKAYFDARRRARAREASTYLDYGFTQPRVMTRGPIEQHPGLGQIDGLPGSGDPSKAELVPTPEPQPSSATSNWSPNGSAEPTETTPSKPATTETLPNEDVPAEPSTRQPAESGKTTRGPTTTNWQAAGQAASRSRPTSSGWQSASQSSADRRVTPASWTAIDDDASLLHPTVKQHEPSENPPAAPVDRPASGWTGVQR
ncbi:MAG: TolC family protein [Thermoguttaceae bacterium]